MTEISNHAILGAMSTELILLLVINLAALGGIAWYLLKKLQPAAGPTSEDQRQQMKSLVNEVFGEVTAKVTEQSRHLLHNEQEIISTSLKSKHQEIEKVITELRRELNDRQKEIRSLEQDRDKQFTEIATQIKSHQKITEKLSEDTDKLRTILSNNQQRGQWGEYILDDILRTTGLSEGIHYVKQMIFASNNAKPDIVLLLPNKRKVAIDVKFPFSGAYKLADANTTEEKNAAKKSFISDVKQKVKQIIDRGYINPEENTMDYAILFVPNEMLFSFINQEAPEVIEYAMQQKVMIVSPFTFLVVARTIMESYRNFMIENHLRDIIRYIGDFVEEWGRFEGEFSKFDDTLFKLRQNFDKLSTTRFSRMRLRLNRIEEARHGVLSDAPLADALPEPEAEIASPDKE